MLGNQEEQAADSEDCTGQHAHTSASKPAPVAVRLTLYASGKQPLPHPTLLLRMSATCYRVSACHKVCCAAAACCSCMAATAAPCGCSGRGGMLAGGTCRPHALAHLQHSHPGSHLEQRVSLQAWHAQQGPAHAHLARSEIAVFACRRLVPLCSLCCAVALFSYLAWALLRLQARRLCCALPARLLSPGGPVFRRVCSNCWPVCTACLPLLCSGQPACEHASQTVRCPCLAEPSCLLPPCLWCSHPPACCGTGVAGAAAAAAVIGRRYDVVCRGRAGTVCATCSLHPCTIDAGSYAACPPAVGGSGAAFACRTLLPPTAGASRTAAAAGPSGGLWCPLLCRRVAQRRRLLFS